MNYLNLLTQTWIKCGLSGAPPATVEPVNDMARRIASFVKEAYVYIQNVHPSWDFLYREAHSQLVEGRAFYLPGDFNAPDFRTLVTLDLAETLPPTGTPLEQARYTRAIALYEDDRNPHRFDNPPDGTPSHLLIKPNGQWRFDAAPTEALPLRLSYYRQAHELNEATDELLIPDEYCPAVIYKAAEQYAYYDSDSALLQEAQTNYRRFMHQMEAALKPPLYFPPSELLPARGLT